MKDFMIISGLYLKQMKNRMKDINREKVLKLSLMIFFGLLFFPVVFALFYWIFRHFNSVPFIGPLLVRKLLSTFYMTFSFLIVLSSIVSAIPVLFLSKDMDYLFSAPVKTESVFTVQYIKVIIDSTWMILLMSVPVFAAYSIILKLTGWQFVMIILAHLPFFLIPASIGIFLTLLLVKYFPAENIRNVAIALFGIFVVVFVVYFRMLQPEKLTGAGLEQAGEFIKNLRTPEFFLMPHTHFTAIVNKVAGYGVMNGMGHFLGFLAVSIIVFLAVILAAKFWYFEGYGRKGVYKKEKLLRSNYSFRKMSVVLTQLFKDFKYLIRDTSQWIQVVFLFGLVVIYLYNMYKMPAEVFNLKNVIYFLNIGFIGFVLSAVGARFVLPVISVEGRAFWIFRTSPHTMSRYVLDKFLVYGIPIVIVGQIVALLAMKILGSDAFINYVTIYSTLNITLVIAGAGIGFGALFADFNIKNPEDLITGAAGLSYMFLTMLYIALVLFLEAGAVKDYFMSKMITAKGYGFVFEKHIFRFVLVAVISIAIITISLIMGIRRLEKLET